nr:NALCN channel auxiliary factor 2 [Anolis sagrei ordinatus]
MRPAPGGGRARPGGRPRSRCRCRRALSAPLPLLVLLLFLLLLLFLASAEGEAEAEGPELDPEAVCGLSPAAPPDLAAFRLPFCAAYSLWDLLHGMARPEGLDCAALLLRPRPAHQGPQGPPLGDWAPACAACLEAYLRLDAHAREKHAEFAALLARLPQAHHHHHQGAYSVRACLQDCQAAYKAWLCSEYFQVAQLGCAHRVPCQQYCWAVQSKCPFVLPDNDQLIYGGLPGFLCTGLMEPPLLEQEAKCCALQWDSCGRRPEHGLNASSSSSSSSMDALEPFDGHPPHSHHQQQQQQHYHLYYHHPQHPAPPPPPSQPVPLLPVSAGSRLAPPSRIRFGLLLLLLLHTMASFSGGHGDGGNGGDREEGGGGGGGGQEE